jgi:hypothetical protein
MSTSPWDDLDRPGPHPDPEVREAINRAHSAADILCEAPVMTEAYDKAYVMFSRRTDELLSVLKQHEGDRP